MYLIYLVQILNHLCNVILMYQILYWIYNKIIKYIASRREARRIAALKKLVPDCRELIFEYHFYEIQELDLPSRQNGDEETPTSDSSTTASPPQNDEKSTENDATAAEDATSDTPPPPSAAAPEITSNLKFALKHFECKVKLEHFSELDMPLLSNKIHTLDLGYEYFPKKTPSRYLNLEFFSHFKNLRELHIFDNGPVQDEMFQCLESLESLTIRGSYLRIRLTDEVFTPLKHLKQLSINCCNFTDHAFEIMHNNGVRLEKLEIEICSRITDKAFSFMKGDSPREVHLNHNENMTGNGLQHLRGVQHLRLCGIENSNCHEAFECLEGSVQSLDVHHSKCINFDDEAMSYLKGISSLVLYETKTPCLTDESFRHLSGSIKKLKIWNFRDECDLSNNMLWHLSGIQELNLCIPGLGIEAEDLSKWKEMLQNASDCLIISNQYVDDATLCELQRFVYKKNGGEFKYIPYN